MHKRNMLVGFAGVLAAGALAFGTATSAVATDFVATNDVSGPSYSVESSLSSDTSSDLATTDGWSTEYPKPFGAGHMATSEISSAYAGLLVSEVSQTYAGPLGGIDASEVDYWRKAGPLTEFASQTYNKNSVAFSDVF